MDTDAKNNRTDQLRLIKEEVVSFKESPLHQERIRNKVFPIDTSYGSVKIIPMYHPAVVLYNSELKKDLQEDFQQLDKIRK